jgi:hypothetical protein
MDATAKIQSLWQAALYRKPSLSASNLPGSTETALNWTACIAKVVTNLKII